MSPLKANFLNSRMARWIGKAETYWRLNRITRAVQRAEPALQGQARPVVMFNASTRIMDVSQNAAFSLLAAWGLRLAGVPVVHFVCQSGMSRCLLGSSEEDHTIQPPCQQCMALSHRLYDRAVVHGFRYSQDPLLAAALQGKGVPDLENFEYQGIPFGSLVLPSVRWRMRRHHLQDDLTTQTLFREFILSAYHVGREFKSLMEQVDPCAVIVFNGQMYPEAMVRYIAQAHGILVLSHEVGYQPYSAFFTSGDATARRVSLTPEELILNPQQNARLDVYLEKRFEGHFTMGGVKFWRDFQGLSEDLERKLADFKQMVPVFANVIFDTSQAHANVVFEHMFAWLDNVLELAKAHPETLFILRAHPDEMRPQSRKQSRETVRQWVETKQAADLPNLYFIDSQDYVNSYELVRRAKFVMVYNSSIGLESVLLGRAVLCGGRAWYSEYPVVYFPPTPESFRQQAEAFLHAEQVELPEAFRLTARALAYYQNFRTTLPFNAFLTDHALRGFVRFLPFEIEQLKPGTAPAINALLTGILRINCMDLAKTETVLTIPNSFDSKI